MFELQKAKEIPEHIIGIQALRGIAVFVVVTSHLHSIISNDPHFTEVTPWSWLNQAFTRGYLGVDLFFVLSGFLITSLLLKNGEGGSKSLLRKFYMRRALRILPALYTLLISSFVIAILERFPLTYQWNSTLSALLFLSNWTFQSHFLHTQDDIGHLWSLAVEEQFYLVWPLIFVALRQFQIHWTVVTTGISILVLIIAIYRGHLWNSQVPWLFIYPKTETRADAILIGCACAYLFRYASISLQKIRILGYISAAALVIISYFYCDVQQGFLYQGGFSLIALLMGILILAIAISSSFGTRLFRSRILLWLGQRSYGMYLYHLLIFRIVGRHFVLGSNFLRMFIAIVVSIAASEASWRLVERPFIRVKNNKYS